MDSSFAVIFYNTIREFHNRYRSQDREMHKEEIVFYLTHLRTATKHALVLEQQLEERLNAADRDSTR